MCTFQITGIPAGATIASDNASNFRVSLTRELMARLGVSPVFSTPYHTVSIVESCIQTFKNTMAKMVYDHKDSWVNYLGLILWALPFYNQCIDRICTTSISILTFATWSTIQFV